MPALTFLVHEIKASRDTDLQQTDLALALLESFEALLQPFMAPLEYDLMVRQRTLMIFTKAVEMIFDEKLCDDMAYK